MMDKETTGLVAGPDAQRRRRSRLLDVDANRPGQQSATPLSFTDGARLAGFVVSGQPIRGGSGLVYRARNTRTGRDVALKTLQADHDISFLRHEAEALARVTHPNIAALHSVQTIGTTAVLEVEWVAGQPLDSIVRSQGRLPLDRALHIFRQIATALDAVHAVGLAHGDVTPANIMVDHADHATLIDFGVSRRSDADTVAVSAGDTMTGTPRYLAPEIIGGAHPSPAADQYGAALILHEMLTGSWPFPESGSMANALHHQLHSQPEPLDETGLFGRSESPVSDAVLRALSKDPADRFRSMEQFWRALIGGGEQRSRPAPPILPLAGAAVLIVLAAVGWLTGWLGDGGAGDNADAGPSAQPTPPALVVDGVTADPDENVAPTTPATTASTPSSRPDTSVSSVWESGLAERLDCNMLTEADFEPGSTLPENYFVDFGQPDRSLARIVPEGGFNQSGALEIGATGYGIWGETVPLGSERSYLLSAHLRLDGPVSAAAVSVYWLDDNHDLIGESSPQPVVEDQGQRITVESGPAPSQARYGVPRLVKEGDTGVLLVDEIVFAPVGGGCDDTLTDR